MHVMAEETELLYEGSTLTHRYLPIACLLLPFALFCARIAAMILSKTVFGVFAIVLNPQPSNVLPEPRYGK